VGFELAQITTKPNALPLSHQNWGKRKNNIFNLTNLARIAFFISYTYSNQTNDIPKCSQEIGAFYRTKFRTKY
jgi:hypothetical protein